MGEVASLVLQQLFVCIILTGRVGQELKTSLERVVFAKHGAWRLGSRHGQENYFVQWCVRCRWDVMDYDNMAIDADLHFLWSTVVRQTAVMVFQREWDAIVTDDITHQDIASRVLPNHCQSENFGGRRSYFNQHREFPCLDCFTEKRALETITQELELLLRDHADRFVPWREMEMEDDEMPHHHHGQEPDSNSAWRVYGLKAFGNKMPLNSSFAPCTSALVESVPGLSLAGFSILKPGAHLRPHQELPGTTCIRSHLCLHLPPSGGCVIRVDKYARTWARGEWLLFDGTAEHEVFHHGDTERAVLLLDFDPRWGVRNAQGNSESECYTLPMGELPHWLQREFARQQPTQKSE
jgi:hypothetical protein